ncbi:MAG: S41 family peptidase [Candidatus Saccharibacteria bacterium]|nr:S41 family peptidase [Candidatus Saccharibacteria bacterium]
MKKTARKDNIIRYKISEVALGTTVFACLVTLIIGFAIGANWDNIWANFSPYLGFKSSSSEQLNLSSVQNLYTVLKDNYDGDIDKNELITGAKKGMVAALGDEYTEYMDSEEAAEYKSALEGEISEAGIGVSFAKREDYVRVLRTLPDNPARKAGILAGDIIYAINDEEVWQQDVDTIGKKLRGEAGSSVKVTVVRDGKKLDFTMTREEINNVSADITYDGDIAILSVYRFSKDTGTLTKKLANEAKEKNIKGIIVDLRGNGGGYVNAARDMLGLWIDGENILTQKSRTFSSSNTSAPRGEAILKDIKTVVLINNGTASASEIVAGALKDYEKATIVGQTSYGKGVVQTMLSVDGSNLLKVTTAHWYTPKGNTINKTGIVPDVEVERTYEQINKDIDPQLDKAKEIVL